MTTAFIDTKDFSRVAVELSTIPKQIPKAASSALNRTMNFTATQMNREVRKEYTIKAKDVRKTIKKYGARPSNLHAYVESTGHTLSLTHFQHKPRKPPKRPKVPQVKIKKSSGYKAVKTTPKAFVQTMNNATNIWKRKGPQRLPVKMLRTLSIPQMISNEEIMKNIQKAAQDKLEERIGHEINWRLEKAAKRRRRRYDRYKNSRSI